ncbi:MAG: ISAs1 family transposase, partial [Legionella sp.]
WRDFVLFGESKIDLLKKHDPFSNGIACKDTFACVFSVLDPEAFKSCFVSWVKSLQSALQDVIAIDGKTLRHSYDKKKRKAAIHRVSAFAVENGVVLGQIKVDDKSNEITAIPALLELLDIKGCIVTIDAMDCQEKIAEKIIQKEGDYILAVKDNQKAVHDEVDDFFKTACQFNFQDIAHDYFEENHKGHGRVESRRHWITDCLDTISKPERWSSLKSIGMVEAETYIDGKTSIEVRYFIASIEPDAKIFANAVRKHWSVENQLHWVREDNSRVRRDNAAENLGVFRHIAINSLRNEKTCKKGIKAKRYKAALQPDYAQVVLNDIF